MKSLAACHDTDSKLVTYFTVNTAFVNYLNSLDNLTNSLKFPILLNRTTYKQTLSISLKLPEFNSELLVAPKTLKTLFISFIIKRRFFDLQERHTDMELVYLFIISLFIIIKNRFLPLVAQHIIF